MDVVALIATVPRFDSLLNISLPSIKAQVYQPRQIVLVVDQCDLTEEEVSLLQSLVAPITLTILNNQRCQGAAGSWNTGISYIREQLPESYIAILDDDDFWSPSHLQLCIDNSLEGAADVVLSGIAIMKEGQLIARNVPADIDVEAFLIGNPGWQGSNTFIKAQLLADVRGFSDGLVSSNDKDLAIRVLSLPNVSISYTQDVSVVWNLALHANALSAKGSYQKLIGCAQFLYLHGYLMTHEQRAKYFERIALLFGLSAEAILHELNTNKEIRLVAGSFFEHSPPTANGPDLT